MNRDEAELVRSTLHHLVETTPAETLPAVLLASGWSDLVAEDATTTVTALAEEQGTLLAATPAIDLVLGLGAGLAAEATTAWVLPPLSRDHATPIDENGRVDGLVAAGHQRATRFLASGPGGIYEIDPAALTINPVGGIDPELGLARAQAANAGGGLVAATDAAAEALAAGRRFVASELVGIAGRMLGDTIEQVTEREQFGRPIAVFQTVKHRLADVHVAIESARGAITTAHGDGTETSAMAAKALAGRAYRTAQVHGQQVHGGIAFTVEHGFDRPVRRGLVLDALLGSADDLTRAIGSMMLAERTIARTPTLGG